MASPRLGGDIDGMLGRQLMFGELKSQVKSFEMIQTIKHLQDKAGCSARYIGDLQDELNGIRQVMYDELEQVRQEMDMLKDQVRAIERTLTESNRDGGDNQSRIVMEMVEVLVGFFEGLLALLVVSDFGLINFVQGAVVGAISRLKELQQQEPAAETPQYRPRANAIDYGEYYGEQYGNGQE